MGEPKWVLGDGAGLAERWTLMHRGRPQSVVSRHLGGARGDYFTLSVRTSCGAMLPSPELFGGLDAAQREAMRRLQEEGLLQQLPGAAVDPALVPNFSWVLPDQLAGSGKPGVSGEREAAYAAVRAAGVRTVVCLVEEDPPTEVIAAAGLQSIWHPIPDLGGPTDLAAFAELLDCVSERIARGSPVLVHCLAGRGRTGLFLASFLARHRGLEARAALAELRRLRPGSVETATQQQLVAATREVPR